MNKKIVVYSCIMGGRDAPLKVKKEDNIDYVMFTDDIPNNDYWDYKPISEDWKDEDPRRTAKYPKVNPHIVLPGYDFSIWIDGNRELIYPVQWYIDKVREYNIAAHKHPTRICAYREASIIKQFKFDYNEKVDKIVEIMAVDGYPKDNGLTENCLLIRKHSDYLSQINDFWWQLIKITSRRDQLSFNYTLWKFGCEVNYLMTESVIMYPHLNKNRRVV